MPAMPREPHLDSSFALRRDPYRYISTRCRAYGTDAFEARILFHRTICMSGARAAALFYDPDRFSRGGGAPEPLRATLFGKGGVQGLDGATHRNRKALFVQLTTPPRVAALVATAQTMWERSAARWAEAGKDVRLYTATQNILARAVFDWAGVPVAEAELRRRTAQIVPLFDDAADFGLGHVRARLARRRAERWCMTLIHDVRMRRTPRRDDALHVIAWHAEASGRLLPLRIAAVELLNVLRPTIAVSVFITLAAHALQTHPECRQRWATGDDDYKRCFIDEVRRHYPFFPAVVARVRRDFYWNGFRFPAGRRVLLDLYGTNHDSRWWRNPDAFVPERFAAHTAGLYEFVPQGGGDQHRGHRCPGEGITVSLMKQAIDFLVARLDYEVPPQRLDIDMARLPALPRDGFVIREVKLRAGA